MSQIDPVALWSTIGTWTAVLLALIALVGIVGPILVLRAVRSERNEALNSLQDVDQDFFTPGIGIGRNFRLFHHVNVLSLVSTFDSDSKQVFTIPRARRKWDLQKVKGTKCRAAWARLCRLLEAYSVVNDKRGSLVLRDRHSWLPVSRFWILTLGLLGRYGRRDGKGFTFNVNALRRDLQESRMLHVDEYFGDDPMTDSNPNSEAERPKPDENSGLDAGSEDELTSTREDRKLSGGREHSTSVVQKHIIYGRTGIIELGDDVPRGKRQAVKSKIRSIIFTLFNEQEMGLQIADASTRSEEPLMREVLSLQQLYWLGAGFLPMRATVNGLPQAVSLQDPLIPQFATKSGIGADPLHSRSRPPTSGKVILVNFRIPLPKHTESVNYHSRHSEIAFLVNVNQKVLEL